MLSSIVVVHKGKEVVGVDDLNMGFHDVAFEGLVLNWCGTFDRITKKPWMIGVILTSIMNYLIK